MGSLLFCLSSVMKRETDFDLCSVLTLSGIYDIFIHMPEQGILLFINKVGIRLY